MGRGHGDRRVSKSDRVRAELIEDHERTSESLANIIGCSKSLVKRIRIEMEESGVIERWRHDEDVSSAVRRELVDDCRRTTETIAHIVGCSQSEVHRIRHEMEIEGEISRWRRSDSVDKTDAVRTELLDDHRRSNGEISRIVGCSSEIVRCTRIRMEKLREIKRWRREDNPGTKINMVRDELLTNYARASREIAEIVGCCLDHVRQTRVKMEGDGEIERWRGSGDVRDRVVVALMDDHERPNHSIAAELGCRPEPVQRARRLLEESGEISVWRDLPSDSLTYVIRGQLTNLIKVGRTNNPASRMIALRIGSPDLLEYILLIPGGKWEKILHGKLERFHHHGEWFEYTDEVCSIIRQTVASEGVVISELGSGPRQMA